MPETLIELDERGRAALKAYGAKPAPATSPRSSLTAAST